MWNLNSVFCYEFWWKIQFEKFHFIIIVTRILVGFKLYSSGLSNFWISHKPSDSPVWYQSLLTSLAPSSHWVGFNLKRASEMSTIFEYNNGYFIRFSYGFALFWSRNLKRLRNCNQYHSRGIRKYFCNDKMVIWLHFLENPPVGVKMITYEWLKNVSKSQN